MLHNIVSNDGEHLQSLCICESVDSLELTVGKVKLRSKFDWDGLSVQLIGGIICAAVLPYLFRILIGSPEENFPIFQSTMASVIVATTLAVWFSSQISTYPGEEAAASLLPAFGLAYGMVMSFLILARWQYNRANLVMGLIGGIVWMFAVFALRKRRRPIIGLVPFGDMSKLQTIRQVHWVSLDSPTVVSDNLDAIAADLRQKLPDEWEKCLADYALSRIPVYHAKHLFESFTGRVELEHLSENNFGSLTPKRAYINIKHTVDWIFAVLLLVILAIPMLLVGVLIKIDTPGPALFIQKRIGYLGKTIKVYKFRTMSANSAAGVDARSAAITKIADQRITKFGRFLRASRIDELPQIFNILKGEMSFIGPRPEAVVLSRWYEEEIPFYRYRHIIRPGITGWAQVRQGHVADVDSVRSKLHYDFYYIKQYSPWIDILIVLKTIKTMITGHGAK